MGERFHSFHTGAQRFDHFLRAIPKMNSDKQTKPWLRLCTGALTAGGVALSTLGLTSGVAQAASTSTRTSLVPGRPMGSGLGALPELEHLRRLGRKLLGPK